MVVEIYNSKEVVARVMVVEVIYNSMEEVEIF